MENIDNIKRTLLLKFKNIIVNKSYIILPIRNCSVNVEKGKVSINIFSTKSMVQYVHRLIFVCYEFVLMKLRFSKATSVIISVALETNKPTYFKINFRIHNISGNIDTCKSNVYIPTCEKVFRWIYSPRTFGTYLNLSQNVLQATPQSRCQEIKEYLSLSQD